MAKEIENDRENMSIKERADILKNDFGNKSYRKVMTLSPSREHPKRIEEMKEERKIRPKERDEEN